MKELTTKNLVANNLNDIKNITSYKYNDFSFLLNKLKKYENINDELFSAYYCIYYLFTTKLNKNDSKLKEFMSNNDENYKVIFDIIDDKIMKLEIIYNMFLLNTEKIFTSKHLKMFLEYLNKNYKSYLDFLNQSKIQDIRTVINCIIEILQKTKANNILSDFYRGILDYIYSLNVPDIKINIYSDFLEHMNKKYHKIIYDKLIEFIEYIINNNKVDLYLQAESACDRTLKFCKRDSYEYSYCLNLKAKVLILQYKKRYDSKFSMSFYLNRVYQIYLSMDKKYRNQFISKNELEDMQNKIIYLRKKIQEEMVEIKSPKIDISEIVKYAETRMRRKKFNDAIKQFAFITYDADYNEMYKYAKNSKEQYIIQHLFPKILFNQLGQQQEYVVYDEHKSEYENALYDMILYNKINIQLKVQASIYPALSILIEEHKDKLTKEFLYEIVRYFGISKEHELLIVEGLYYGFNKDFIASTHVLIPQIENILREILMSNKQTLYLIEKNGKDVVKGINTILSEQYREILWKDISPNLYMEFKTLLDDEKGGLNLRNLLAHGLLQYDNFKSVYTIYLWWIIFRWFFIVYTINNKK